MFVCSRNGEEQRKQDFRAKVLRMKGAHIAEPVASTHYVE